MNINIYGWKETSESDVASQVKNRVHFALGRFASCIRQVNVRLRDMNGPKGGIDKHCQMQLTLLGGGQMVVERRDACWFDVVDAAATSASRTVARILSHAQHLHRASMRRR